MEQIRLNLDRDGFSRRECPECGAHFKVPWSGREEGVVAAALAGLVRHVNSSELEGCCAAERFCPYCAARAPATRFLTSDALARIAAHARKLEGELRWRRLRAPLDTPAGNARPTYIAVAPDDVRVPPPRADWDDLARMLLPCCGEEQKVSDAWMGPIRCHLCGTAHLRSGARDVGLELAQLLSWTTG